MVARNSASDEQASGRVEPEKDGGSLLKAAIVAVWALLCRNRLSGISLGSTSHGQRSIAGRATTPKTPSGGPGYAPNFQIKPPVPITNTGHYASAFSLKLD